MCLVINQQFKNRSSARAHKPLVADKNIVVYKRLSLQRFGDGALVSPYFNARYNLGETYTSKLTRYCLRHAQGWIVAVSRGIHSYTTVRGALRHAYGSEVILRCIIPKGAEYWIGDDDDIVATQLRLPIQLKDYS